jgi:hypothetical protein
MVGTAIDVMDSKKCATSGAELIFSSAVVGQEPREERTGEVIRGEQTSDSDHR